ncbi:hypothetical protein [Blastopirellula marina]|uniref:Uncharacterized protein n=1 Tax=Blastopirellula marina DSM 3645 TaxID=314230 RepID=A4A2H3_9BACT|nr:hypothetical protein [Blastopirellula marina]EAQ77040.1 hypothetical protein DSM3645_04290 [Blastopirellula marina DSM 3645]
MKIVYLTRDLMFPSRAQQAARTGGVTLQVVGSPEQCTEAIDDETERVVVDLSSTGAPLADLAVALKAKKPELELIAYGPHVQSDRLAAAKAAGFRTMTNGQVHSGMKMVFGE